MIQLLKDMLEIDSETSKEQHMSDFLRDYCRNLYFDEVTQDENGNVIAVIDAGAAGKIINFNGHMDTKPVPQGLEVSISDGRIYGRGSVDMKGGIAAMLHSVSGLIKEKGRLNGKVVYSFVVCEESGTPEIRKKGTPTVIEYFKKRDLVPDAVIIGESSQIYEGDSLTLMHGQRGRHVSDIRIIGESAHGGFGAGLGVNAAVVAGLAKTYLFDYANKLTRDSVNVSERTNEDNQYNVVPKDSIIRLDVRFKSNDSLKKIKEDIRQIVGASINEIHSKYGKKAGFEVDVEEEIYGPSDFSNAELLQVAKQSYVKVTNKEVKSTWSVFGTDASFYIENGIFTPLNANIIIAGPGSQEMAHTDKESAAIRHLEQYSKIYAELVLDYLKK